jgi:hypothetical protein
VRARWEELDARPALVFDDVADLAADGFKTDTPAAAGPLVWLNHVRAALIPGSRTLSADSVRVTGSHTDTVKLINQH